MTAEQVQRRAASWYIALVLAAPSELARARELALIAEEADGRMVYTSYPLLQGGTVMNKINSSDIERNN